jgi:hypothetical protein
LQVLSRRLGTFVPSFINEILAVSGSTEEHVQIAAARLNEIGGEIEERNDEKASQR